MTTKTATPHELKPCPFCGNKSHSFQHDNYWFGIECEKCECEMRGFSTLSAAVHAWNTRPYFADLLSDYKLKNEVKATIWTHVGNIGLKSPKLEAAAQAAIAAIRKAL